MKQKNWPSISFLKPKIKKFLAAQGAKCVLFADDSLPLILNRKFKSTDTIDIVLFGNFLSDILNCYTWPNKKLRIWVLCERSKNCLVKIFKIKPTHVGVIPRSAIFEPQRRRPAVSPEKEITFVYSGRVSRCKNIETLIFTVWNLQNKYDAKLIILGKADGLGIPSKGIKDISSVQYAKKIQSLIYRLKWKEKPNWIKNLGPNEWKNKKFKNPILINLSTHTKEDFNVSAAQAEQMQWPAILSDWGAFADTQFRFKLLINPKLILSKKNSAVKGAQIANFIQRNWHILLRPRKYTHKQFNLPKPVMAVHIKSKLRKFAAKFGNKFLFSNLEYDLAPVANQKNVKKLFKNYEKIFSGIS